MVRERVTWKIGTWNIRSIQGKEMELEEEFEEIGLDVLAITETKKKGQGESKLEKGNILIYSGVDVHARAAAGVGCIIHKKLSEQIYCWKGWSERIMTVELRDQMKNIQTIIIVYGPNDDDSAQNKDTFWEELTIIMEQAKGKVILAGDFNSRVGRKDELYNTVLGIHGELTRNNNGERMLDFCMMHDLVITNTFFEHKNINKYTREVKSRNEKSIIDYVLVERSHRKTVLDTKVRRGPEIGSDHYLVITKIREEIHNTKNVSTKPIKAIQYESIKSYKLLNKEVAERFKQKMTRMVNSIDQTDNETIEKMWLKFKETILDTAKEICGTSKKNNKKRQTAWWTQEVKEQIKIKKNMWKIYLNDRTAEKYEVYKEARKQVKKLVLSAKRNNWIEFGDKMERDSKGNQKLFYRTLKSLRKEKSKDTCKIKNKNGNMLTTDTEVMDRWREYFRELLGEERAEKQRTQENIREESIREHITLEELQEAINKLKNGKAPGNDRLTSEMIKNMGQKATELLLKIYNRVWKEEHTPEDWQVALIVPLYKKGDIHDCNNYRGITLLSVAMKIYEIIIDNKIKPIVENTLAETQSGFRKGRSIQDHIFSIKQVIEKSFRQEKKIYLGFIDLEKAFDKVRRERLWEILRRRGINNKIVRIIRNVYNSNKNRIISQGRISEEFSTKDGLRQGGGLSPVLFTVYIDEVIKKCDTKTKKLHVGYRRLQGINFSEGVFADDIVIMTKSERDLQENLEIWNVELKEQDMKLSKSKTKVMVIGKEPEEINISIDQIKIEQVKSFKYLGVDIEESGNQELEINTRLRNTQKIYQAMNSKFISKREISRKTKLDVFKAIYRPILTSGCESWVLTKRQKSKIQAMEMKYLRRVRGVTKRDRLRNTEIREDLKIQSTLEFIETRQLSWWGHLQRLSDTRPVKLIWEARIQKTKKRGRPRKTWDDVLGDVIKKKGQTWSSAKEIARNKKEWTKFVHM